MKEIITILTLLFTLFIGTGFAQQSNIDERLLVKFTQEELNSMDAEELELYSYCIENAFEIMPFPAEKEGKSQFDGTLKIENIESLNFFDLDISLKENQYQYYKLEGTNNMLVIKPIFLIKQEL